jgi:hypothetical protein
MKMLCIVIILSGCPREDDDVEKGGSKYLGYESDPNALGLVPPKYRNVTGNTDAGANGNGKRMTQAFKGSRKHQAWRTESYGDEDKWKMRRTNMPRALG